MNTEDQLKTGLTQLGIAADTELPERMSAFVDLLTHWNRRVNLTAINDARSIVSHHLLDSAAVNRFVTGDNLLDVGSGAGLPGIPLALMNPEKQFVLLDSNGKKTRFMTQAKIQLGLDNVEVVQSRIEEFTGRFDHVVCRAFTSLVDFIRLTATLLGPGGSLLAMKGPGYVDELKDIGNDDVTVNKLDVPGLTGQRFLLEIAPAC